MKKTTIEDIVSRWLEERTFEEFLEEFDLTPEEIVVLLYNSGHLDEEILENIGDVSEL